MSSHVDVDTALHATKSDETTPPAGMDSDARGQLTTRQLNVGEALQRGDWRLWVRLVLGY